jgi:hypothetical protein
MTERWSDEKLELFHKEFITHVAEFHEHIGNESYEQQQQQELHDAVFRKEDKEENVPPGILQLIARISTQIHDMRVWQDRQKTFIGGVMFTVSAVWFFLTEAGHKLFQLWGKL